MDHLKIGIIGAGSRGIMCFGKLFAAHAKCRLTALADANSERLKAAREYLGDSELELYESVADMLTESQIDAVAVATPDYLHKDHIIAALQAGKHVLSDKPLATKARDCLEIGRVANKTGKIVDMGFNLRHETVCRKIKELIVEGAVGRVQMIDNRDYYGGGRTYMSRWNRYYEKSGGLFCHKGSHDFDLLNWYNAGAIPTKVSAFAGINVLKPEGLPFPLEEGEQAGPYCGACQVAHKCPDKFDLSENPLFTETAAEADGYHKDTCMYLSEKDTHDTGIAIVEYENGVRASHWECFYTPISTRRFTLMGDRGFLDADLSLDKVTVIPRWSLDRIEYNLKRPEGGHGGADPMMVDAFVDNLLNNRRPLASVRDGALSVAIADAAERSRREGRVVEIEELLTREEIAELS